MTLAASSAVAGEHRSANATSRHALLRRLLALADLIAGVAGALVLAASGQPVGTVLWTFVLLPIWVVSAKLHGLYDRDQRRLRHLTLDELPQLVVWVTTTSLALMLFLFLTGASHLDAGLVVQMWLSVGAAAVILRAFVRLCWRRLTPPEHALLVGSGPLAEGARRKLELFGDIHVEVVATRPTLSVEDLADPSWLLTVDRVLLALPAADTALISELLSICRAHQIKLSIVPPGLGLAGTAVYFTHVADLPLVEVTTWHASRSTLLLKRVIDLTVASIAIVVLAPLMLAIAVAVKLDSAGPLLFRQRRAGAGGRPFQMVKFRTMVANAEDLLEDLVRFDELADPMFKLPADPRVTRVGRFLRRWSMDELPQLWNVLRGEMSLVGPRPEQIELTERYELRDRTRVAVRPGITGPMQVFGRADLTFAERIALERDYADNISLKRDWRILGLTIAAVFTRRGAY